jgi:RNA polymerase sigma factor (sigma-70 family)
MSRRFLSYCVLDPALQAEDIEQEAVLRALELRKRYNPEQASFGTFLWPWLKGYVLRTMRFRGMSGLSHGLDSADRSPVFVSQEDVLDSVFACDMDVHSFDLDAMLTRLSRTLDAQEFDALIRYTDGWSISDIARSLNVPSMPEICRILGRARMKARLSLSEWSDDHAASGDVTFRADVIRALGIRNTIADRIDSGEIPSRLSVEKVVGYLSSTRLDPLGRMNWGRTVHLREKTVKARALAALDRFGGVCAGDDRRRVIRRLSRVRVITCGMVERIAAILRLSPGDLIPEEWTR